MEEIAKTAAAYYSKLPAEQKQLAIDIFRSMDVDGDGMITYDEYRKYIGECEILPSPKFFNLFDKDKNGALDFNEYLCWHYLLLTNRLIICDGCGNFLPGVFFSCSLCFHTHQTYDLCSSCYKNNNGFHQHSADNFLDNYVLLILNRQIFLENQQQEEEMQQQMQVLSLQRGAVGSRGRLNKFANGLSIASSVVSMCSQM